MIILSIGFVNLQQCVCVSFLIGQFPHNDYVCYKVGFAVDAKKARPTQISHYGIEFRPLSNEIR